jgi:hypothetical protein
MLKIYFYLFILSFLSLSIKIKKEAMKQNKEKKIQEFR